jgi:GntR family transcriptional regulator
MRRGGRTPSSRLVERAVAAASPAEAARLQLKGGDSVVVVRRIRLADELPIALERAAFPGSLADAILAADLETGSLHATLVRAGRVPTSGTATIGAEPVTRADAELLDVDAGAALLVERRLIADQHGAPLELTESRYAGERYALDVDFVVEPAR